MIKVLIRKEESGSSTTNTFISSPFKMNGMETRMINISSLEDATILRLKNLQLIKNSNGFKNKMLNLNGKRFHLKNLLQMIQKLQALDVSSLVHQ